MGRCFFVKKSGNKGCFIKKVENRGFFCKKVDLSSTQGALCIVSVFFYFTFYLGLFGGCVRTQRTPLRCLRAWTKMWKRTKKFVFRPQCHRIACKAWECGYCWICIVVCVSLCVYLYVCVSVGNGCGPYKNGSTARGASWYGLGWAENHLLDGDRGSPPQGMNHFDEPDLRMPILARGQYSQPCSLGGSGDAASGYCSNLLYIREPGTIIWMNAFTSVGWSNMPPATCRSWNTASVFFTTGDRLQM